MSEDGNPRKSAGWPELLGLFAAALAIRWIHVWQIGAAPFAAMRMGDAEGYHEWAARIAAGAWLGGEVFYQAPLYPYFLGSMYAVFGEQIGTLRAIQAVVGALSCVWLCLAGSRWFGRREGLAAGLMLAIYAPAIYFDTLLQKSVLDLFFVGLLLWIAGLLADEPERNGGWVALGAALGGLALTRENALVFLPGILAWSVLGFGGLGKRRYVQAVLFAAGIALVLLPVAFRNLTVGGEFHLTTSQFGPNLYIGNHQGASGLYEPLRERRGHVRFEREDAIAIAEKATGRTLTPGEVSSYYTSRVAEFVGEHPGEWLALLGKKTVLTWNAVEISDTEDQYTYAGHSWILRGAGLLGHLGVLAPLALFGIWATAADRRRVWLLYLLLAIYVASVVAFFVFARYRLPMVPFLILFAGAGVVRAPRFIRDSSPARLAGCAASVLAMAVFCNWPAIDRERMTGTTRFNLGAAFAMQGRQDEALEQYRKAVEIRPNYFNAWYSLGTTLLDSGSAAEALPALEQALRLRGDHADAWLQLGRVHGALGDPERAVTHYEASLRHDPDRALTHYILGNALQRRGDANRAAEHYQEAIRLDPDYAQAYNNLGNLHLAARNLEQARPFYEQAIRLDAGNAQAHYNLGVVFELGGDRERAMAMMQQAVKLKPDFEMARKRLQSLRRAGSR